MACLSLYSDPITFIQATLPHILLDTEDEFFANCLDLLKQGANILFERMKEIPCIRCDQKPKGAVFVMAQLNLSLLEDIEECYNCAWCYGRSEELALVLLCHRTISSGRWQYGITRFKAFCQRHAKRQ